MKVQCDVCAAEAASVFCCADEAALCDSCDHRIHRANKLAGKHTRFSLLQPSSFQTPPICDRCQEKRGFLFCMEDRAILCRDCDVQIHSANQLTMNHRRFLLAGVRLSASPVESSPAGAEAAAVHSSSIRGNSTGSNSTAMTTNSNSNSSSISDYLLNMLPGWHVEDFLIDDTATTDCTTAINAFCKTDDVAEVFGGDQKRNGLEPRQANCWVSHDGGVGLKEAKARAKQRWSKEDSAVRVPQPQLLLQGAKKWDSKKRSRISVRYL